jgi:hypothetical protein
VKEAKIVQNPVLPVASTFASNAKASVFMKISVNFNINSSLSLGKTKRKSDVCVAISPLRYTCTIPSVGSNFVSNVFNISKP